MGLADAVLTEKTDGCAHAIHYVQDLIEML
jgi:hypothetical protein